MAVTAQKIKKSLKGNKLTFLNVEKELKKLGYIVVFFNTPKGDEEISRYKLENKKQTLKAFTYTRNAYIVFVDGNLHAEDKLHLILHELGHIVLGHIGDGKLITRDPILMDIEADNFAHSIISQKNNFSFVSALAIAIFIITLMFTSFHDANKSVPATVSETPKISEPETKSKTYAVTDNISSTVYVTPSGKKFHKGGCRYIKNKKLTKYTRNEALEKYDPCSVCNP